MPYPKSLKYKDFTSLPIFCLVPRECTECGYRLSVTTAQVTTDTFPGDPDDF